MAHDWTKRYVHTANFMKILHVVFNQTGKGSYWRAFHFGRELAKRGHEVTLMSTSPGRRLGIRVQPLEGMTHVETPDLFCGALRSGWDPWNTLRRMIWLHQRPFDLIYAIEARPTVIYPALLLRRTRRIPLVLGWSDWFGRGGAVEQRQSPLVRTLLRGIETFHEERFRPMADGTTVICSTLRDKALALGVSAESMRLIPDGCDPTMFDQRSIKEARSCAGLPADDFLIGYVGTIFQGDAELMATSFDLVRAELPSARLLVAGYCPLDIRKLSRHPDAITQTGPIPQHLLNACLAACDMFWLPLRDTNANRGRWPHKLNDYMAIGRPIVATAVGDVGALFDAQPIGLLSPDQAGPFAAQSLHLAGNPELRRQMGEQAQKVAREQFSWEALTDELEQLYFESVERVAAQKSGSRPEKEHFQPGTEKR